VYVCVLVGLVAYVEVLESIFEICRNFVFLVGVFFCFGDFERKTCI